eukprot:GHRR01015183.1.p1 GENE.GHRR01015183.1~~GHRR01015183.1.p1  ORF type:complete len:109 (-),score=17.72 GHRR01015183.1:253-579(-)
MIRQGIEVHAKALHRQLQTPCRRACANQTKYLHILSNGPLLLFKELAVQTYGQAPPTPKPFAPAAATHCNVMTTHTALPNIEQTQVDVLCQHTRLARLELMTQVHWTR